MGEKTFKLFLILFFISSSAFAETIVFKWGKTLEGTIIERTDKYIKIDFLAIKISSLLDTFTLFDWLELNPIAIL